MSNKMLFNTDADCEIQAAISAEIDTRQRFIIEYTCSYDYDHSRDFQYTAIVDSTDTAKLAAYYKVKIEDLPALFYDKCGIPYDSRPSVASSVCKEPLQVLLDTGLHYKMVEDLP